MNYLKMLGLAAIAAMGLMAFLGAGSASATVICKTNADPCPSAWMVNSGEELSATLEGTAALESTGGETLDTCTGGSVSGPTEQTGSATETVSIKSSITQVAWSGCTATTDTVSGGTTEFHKINGVNAFTVTVRETKVTVNIFGVSCVYGFESTYKDIGKFIPAEPPKKARMEISTIVPKTSGGFLCPSETRWTATYVATSPNEGFLYAAES
jgi:hypothetical protein